MKNNNQERTRLDILNDTHLYQTPAEERFDRITRLAKSHFNVPIAMIALITEKTHWVKSCQGFLATEAPREITFCSMALESGVTMVIPDTHENLKYKDNQLVKGDPFIRFYAGQPFYYKDHAIGTLCIIDTAPRDKDSIQLDFLKDLTNMVEDALLINEMSVSENKLIKELDVAKREALIDPLTKLWNRRGFDQLCEREFERSKYDNLPASLMFVDVDKFKQINDTHGHDFGDYVLRDIAQRIRSCLRSNDVVCRYGGDEFLIFINEQTILLVEQTAKRLLEAIRSNPIVYKDNSQVVSVTIGIGHTDASKDVSMDTLIIKADEALYEGKNQGRNCFASKSLDS